MPRPRPNPIDVHIGQRVRQRRIFLGMSQETLGEALGLTFQQIQKYEKGFNRVSGSRLVQIADALHVAPAWLFEGAPGQRTAGTHAEADADMSAFMTSADGLVIARSFVQIRNAKVRHAVASMVKTMAEQRGELVYEPAE